MPKEDPFVNRAQLLKAIKKYPEIWDSNNKLHMCRSVTAPLWNEIAEQFGGHVPTVKLQSIWSQMKYHYHNLVHRQILHKERFTTKWEHFEPMSFMYNITVAKIVGSASANADSSQMTPVSNSVSPAAVATSLTNAPTPPMSSSSSSTSTSHLTMPATTVTTTQHHQGRGRPSGTFTSWLPPSNQHHQQQQPQHSQHPPRAHHQQQQQQPMHSQLVDPSSVHDVRSELINTSSGVDGSPQFGDFSGLVPPQTAALNVATNVSTLRKPGRPGSLNNSMRGRIIDAIKAHPVLWAGRQREPQPRSSGQNQNQNRTSAIWKEIAAELGLTPSLVQTRWSIIKQRYVDELQKERHSQYIQQGFRSTWEHFDRMSFMREILTKKVDEREQTREHIQEIVSEQQQQHHQHHQQQQQQQQQHVQQQQQAHLLRYNGRPPPPPPPPSLAMQHPAMMISNNSISSNSGLTSLPCVTSSGLVAAAAAAAAAAGHSGSHSISSLCGENISGVGVGVPSGINAVAAAATTTDGMLPMHFSSVIGRRRVKTESDLEWDPFEMILQVHGTEPAAN